VDYSMNANSGSDSVAFLVRQTIKRNQLVKALQART
jgi:hypothetical protein